MNVTIIVIFALVYLGMILGRFPGLGLDRTGAALLGAIALLVTGGIEGHTAWDAIDVPTMGLLFGLMVLSAQFRLGGFYTAVIRRVVDGVAGPRTLLAGLVAVSGILSALLANDIVCLAVAPLVLDACSKRRWSPKPFLLALALSANAGSAATLIGNPQNMLIGQSLGLSFAGYLADAAVPAILGLALIWWIIARRLRNDLHAVIPVVEIDAPPFNPWQSFKGLAILAAVVAAFLVAPWPRELVALAAAGLILMSRRMHSRRMLAMVDWQLLVLFISLFVVNHALLTTDLPTDLVARLRTAGLDPTRPSVLFCITPLLSNLVSNVPAVMLLLPIAHHPSAGAILALSSTFAGNLLIVGSIANIIVVEEAARFGVRISWGEHARVGIPTTLGTLAITAAWLAVRSLAP